MSFEVSLQPRPQMSAEAQEIPLNIVYEDDDVLVIDKPPGLVVHPAAGHEDGTLVNALLHHAPEVEGLGDEARLGPGASSTKTRLGDGGDQERPLDAPPGRGFCRPPH